MGKRLIWTLYSQAEIERGRTVHTWEAAELLITLFFLLQKGYIAPAFY